MNNAEGLGNHDQAHTRMSHTVLRSTFSSRTPIWIFFLVHVLELLRVPLTHSMSPVLLNTSQVQPGRNYNGRGEIGLVLAINFFPKKTSTGH